jgi:hypothetical protein
VRYEDFMEPLSMSGLGEPPVLPLSWDADDDRFERRHRLEHVDDTQFGIGPFGEKGGIGESSQ